MDRKKRILKAVIFLLLAAAFYGIGIVTDIWALLTLPTATISLAKVIQCGVVIFATLFAENLIVFLLGFMKTENHRKRTALSLIKNLMRYVAVVVIICGIIAALFAETLFTQRKENGDIDWKKPTNVTLTAKWVKNP